MTRYLGEFEYAVLLALLRCGEPAAGVDIHDEILGTTGRDTSIPAVYVTLSRMAEKGYVRVARGKPTDERGGRNKKRYQLTAAGTRALMRSRDLFARLWEGVELSPQRGD